MDPNQQQPNNQQFYGPQPGPTPPPPSGTPYSNQSAPAPPVFGTPEQQFTPQPLSQAAPPPQDPGLGPQPEPIYAVDYLDQIAPPPPRPNFLSGTFGKVFFILIGVFVLAVSIIIAFGNQRTTASVETVAARSEQLRQIAEKNQKNFKSGKLEATNGTYMIWLKDIERESGSMLAGAGVNKSKRDKAIVTKEESAGKKLAAKLEDARLNATLDRVYASEMAYQTQLFKADLDKMAKKEKGKGVRDFAAKASKNLTQIQKAFADFNDAAN